MPKRTIFNRNTCFSGMLSGNVIRRMQIAAVVVGLGAAMMARPAHAQSRTAETLSKMDITLGGLAEITKSTDGHTPPNSGVNYVVSQTASEGVGGIATIRYTKSSLVGGEFNFKETVTTEGYTLTPALYAFPNPFTVQSRVQEYSGGYVYHTREFGHIKPFAAVGFGTTKFKPTKGGGEGLNAQYRATEYFSIGVDDPVFTKHIGIRLQVRGVFFKPPDFGQNYLTTNAHTYALEPVFGFYFHF